MGYQGSGEEHAGGQDHRAYDVRGKRGSYKAFIWITVMDYRLPDAELAGYLRSRNNEDAERDIPVVTGRKDSRNDQHHRQATEFTQAVRTKQPDRLSSYLACPHTPVLPLRVSRGRSSRIIALISSYSSRLWVSLLALQRSLMKAAGFPP